MVKADLTRDYYGDLELAPTADVAEIKKQFKKLALAYHPDRNPGRESEVTAKFQRIQSAHEVLIDATERAKYDANRLRTSAGTYRNSYAGASGMRGNPWSNVSSQYPTPPKPPTSTRKSQPPPPSSGAERYRKNFQTPQASAYQAAQEGPQARKNMYEGWENLRHPKTEHGPGKTWKTPQAPPRGTPTSGREESNARSQRPVPPRPAPAEGSSERSHSSSAANRKGFMPNTPGGDEPPAPRGNYFTNRDKPIVAPDLPAREPSSSARYPAQDPSQNPIPDPLRSFKAMPSMEPRPSMETRPPMEPRLSTPYATHGGEKLNPFESANIHRSKSTRERTDTFSAQFNSSSSRETDTNYKSPHRARSFAETSTPRPSKPYASSVDIDSSSDDDYVPPSRSSGYKQQTTIPQQPRETAPQPTPNANAPNPTSKPSNISIMRQWMKENPGVEPPINGFPPEGPPLRSGQAKNDANGNPSIFNFDPNEVHGTSRLPKKTFSSSAENISTTFTPDDWEGKFEAGGDYFKPDLKAEGPVPFPARGRAQSGSRSRGRSPVKARPVPGEIPSFAPPTEPTPTEPPGANFSAEEWNQTFKPGTFAPPPPRVPVPAFMRKKTPTLRTTLGGKAAVVDDSSSNEDKPLFTGRKPTASPTSIDPEPMDVDTPPANHTVPQFTAAKISEKLSEPLKRSAESASASPADTAEVNLGLNDLKIKDLITTLNFPQVPQPPATPTPSELASPSQLAYDKYLERYGKYISEWDLYSAKFLLHLLARKNVTADLGAKRWTDEVTTEQYRLGLKEDQAVLVKWQESMAGHERVVREFCIVRERMKGRVGVDAGGASVGKRASPRKKTH